MRTPAQTPRLFCIRAVPTSYKETTMENIEILSLNIEELVVEELEERLELAGGAACASCDSGAQA